MTRRIAILMTNTDRSAFAAQHPHDGQKVTAALSAHRPDWHYEVWMARDGQFPASWSEVDGVVITGSPASVNDDAPWIVQVLRAVQQLHAANIPTVGLCFGHQLIAKALGGQVQQHSAWGLGTGHVDWRHAKSWMQPAQARTVMCAAHQDQVTALPPGATRLGGSEFCENGSFLIGRMWGIQHHPEMPASFMHALLDHLTGKLPSDVITAARQSMHTALDSHLVNRWIVQFLESAA